MARKSSARYFILTPILLVMTLAAGCGGGGEGEVGIIGLAQGRWGHTATLLEDGRVLVVGGQGTPSGKLATAEVYDLTGTWSSAGSMSEARGEAHTATLLEDGRVLVVGDSSSVDVYDPSSGQWSTTGSMSDERLEHTATLLDDGRVLVAGGISGRRDLDSAEVYDPSTGEWSATGDMSEKRQSHKAVLLGDGTVLVLGKSTAEIYDPSTGSWSLTSKLVSGKNRWGGYTLTVLKDGRVLIAGGAVQPGASGGIPGGPRGGGFMLSHSVAALTPTTKVDIYDPTTGIWSAASPMLEGHKFHAAILMPDGRVMVIGDDTAEIYDSAANTWSSAGELNVARFDWHTATLLEDDTVMVVGGSEGADPFIGNKQGAQGLTAVEIYDSATGWQFLREKASP